KVVRYPGTRSQLGQGVSPGRDGKLTGAPGLASLYDRHGFGARVYGGRSARTVVSTKCGEIQVRSQPDSCWRFRYGGGLVRASVCQETIIVVWYARRGDVPRGSTHWRCRHSVSYCCRCWVPATPRSRADVFDRWCHFLCNGDDWRTHCSTTCGIARVAAPSG